MYTLVGERSKKGSGWNDTVLHSWSFGESNDDVQGMHFKFNKADNGKLIIISRTIQQSSAKISVLLLLFLFFFFSIGTLFLTGARRDN